MKQRNCARDGGLSRGVAGGRKIHRAEAGDGVLMSRVIVLGRGCEGDAQDQ
jgi:hypothetical protein